MSKNFRIHLPDLGVDLRTSSLQATLRHTAQSDLQFDTGYYPTLKTAAKVFADVQLRYGEEILFRGVMDESELTTSETGGEDSTSAQVVDRTWFLTRDGPSTPFEVASKRVDQAIRDYAAAELDNWDVTVTDQPGSPVVTDQLAFEANTTSEWEAIISALDEDDRIPLARRNDRLEVLQTCWVTESSDLTRTGTALQQDSEYSNGEAESIQNSDESLELTFTTEHTILESELEIPVRFTTGAPDPQSEAFGPGLKLSLNGETWQPVSDSAGFGPLDWRELAQNTYGNNTSTYAGGDISPGTYTLTIEGTTSGDGQAIDVVGPLRGGLGHQLDNDVHEDGGYLDRPYKFPPNGITIETIVENRNSNIEAARLTTSWADDDVGGAQALALTNQDDQGWISASNTDSLDVNFADSGSFGENLRARLTLGPKPTDIPQNATPRYGYEPQAVESLELRFDQTSIPIISDADFDEDHFANLQRFCRRGRMRMWCDPASETKRLEIFPIGTTGPDVEWSTESSTDTVSTGDYSNRVTVRGARDENGERYETTVEDQDEIDALRQEMEDAGFSQEAIDEKLEQKTTVLDVELESESEVNAAAYAELQDAVSEREDTGTIEIVPTLIPVGYAYPVEELGGVERELNRLTFNLAYGDDSGTLEFADEESLVPQLVRTRGEVSGIKTRL